MSHKLLGTGLAALTALTILLACSGSSDKTEPIPNAAPVTQSDSAWRFVVHGDTQWASGSVNGVARESAYNPNTVAVGIIKRVNEEIIKLNSQQKIDFVVQVGDLTDNPSKNAIWTTAKYRQALYNAGIGFFPLRGNHENYATSSSSDQTSEVQQAAEIARVFPQTQNGLQNNVPSDVLNWVPTTEAGQVTKTGNTFTVGSNFSSPTGVNSTSVDTYKNINADYTGLTYSFDNKNARFIILDQFAPQNGNAPTSGRLGDSTYITHSIAMQQPWISQRLSGRTSGTHAFVFAHKALVHENHTDVLFGSTHHANPDYQNAFMKSLQDNGVRYFISGHDHMHSRSVYKSPDQTSEVMQIVSASCSHKFYTPLRVAPDDQHNLANLGFRRQTMVRQDLYTVGFYVYTVDGDKVTVEYYASSPVTGGASDKYDSSGNSYDIVTTPSNLVFTRRDIWGYNLKGKKFVIAQGGSYTTVEDGAARILSGTNNNTMVDGDLNAPAGLTYGAPKRQCSNQVTTSWTTKTSGLYTDIFTLWGMALEFGSDKTDEYCLSISYDASSISDSVAKSGKVGIATKGSDKWVNAVSKNIGGTAKFNEGAYNASTHKLGDWGVDTANKRFWAVVNYNSDFAVAPSI